MRRLFRSKLAWSVLAVLALAVGVFGYNNAHAGAITDCTINSIIKCGEQTPADFIARAQTNNPSDLQAIYQDFGLVPSEYSQFVTHAEMGMAYQNGTIVVNGQTVATNAWSIGRTKFSYSTPMTIAGHTYYKSMDTQVLKQNLPVMVMFDGKGQMQFAAMTACGNPATGTPVSPTYSCDLLQKTPVQGQQNTYSFTTSASAANNASVAKVVYDFGDGTSATETSPSTPVTHTYSTPGTYTAKVTVYVNLPGNQQVTVTSATCETQITVQAPPQVAINCTGLDATQDQTDDLTYTFQANTSVENAVLAAADFDFGDGMTSESVAPNVANGTAVSVSHTYQKPGTYNVQATVHFTVQGQDGQTSEKTATCSTSVTTTACATNANLPASSSQCQCKYNSSLPPTSPKCVAPVSTVLPNTGAGDVIGLFLGASLAGFFGYRYFLSRRLSRE